MKMTELVEIIKELIDSLEYVDRAHPGQVTGGAVRYERISKAKTLIEEGHEAP